MTKIHARDLAIDVAPSPVGSAVVRVKGTLRGNGVSSLHRTVSRELSRGLHLLVLDLIGVVSIDPRGVRTLAAIATAAGEHTTDLCLVVGATPNPVETALTAAEMTDDFELYASITEAQAYLR